MERRGRSILREVTHDLQSFYWIILMYGVGFMPNKFAEPETIYSKLFLASNWDEMTEARRAWLREEIPGDRWGSQPMRYLMENLKAQVRLSVPGDDNPRPVKLKHESFLAVLDKALEMQGWPEKDHLRNVLERLSSRTDEGESSVPGTEVLSRSWTSPIRRDEPPNPLDTTTSDPTPRRRPRVASASQPQDAESIQSGAQKRMPAVNREEEGNPTKRRRLDEPVQRNCPTPVTVPTSIPRQRLSTPSSTAPATRLLQIQRGGQSTRSRAIEGQPCPPSRALLSRVMRSRCCGFWRHLLRR